MEKLAQQLSIGGRFRKELEHYKSTLQKVRQEQESTRDARLRRLADITTSTIKELPIPVVNSLVGKGAEIAAEHALEKLQHRQLLQDAKRLENPLENVTKVFVDELNSLADGQAT